MRISTQSIYAQGLSVMQDLEARLARTQLEVASGRRVLQPADDPIAAARALDLDAAIARTDQHQRNANIAGNRLALEEQVLQDVGNLLYRVRDLVVQASNDTQTAETRGLIATEIAETLSSLVQLANTADGEGHFLFSGFKSGTVPFVQVPGGVAYQGDQGQRFLAISDTREVADGDSGAQVFQLVPNGNGRFVTTAGGANTGTGVLGASSVTDLAARDGDTYTITFTAADTYEVTDSGGAVVSAGTWSDGDAIAFAGVSVDLKGAPATGDTFTVSPSTNQDMFTTLDNIVTALQSSVETPEGLASLHNALNNALEDLDQGVGHLLEVRTRVGSRLQVVESQQSANEDYRLVLAESAAGLTELDYSEALTRLNLQLTQLEAAQQSFVRLQGLSLFRFL